MFGVDFAVLKEEEEAVRKKILIAVLLLAAAPAFAGDDPSDMAARAKSWEAAFNAGDVDAIAALYTEDGCRLAYQAPAVESRSEIPANIQATRDAGITEIKLAVVRAEAQGNMGWGRGTYQLMDGSGATVQQGKWMNVSRKVGGKWLIACDIWNTNAPE